MNVAQKLLLASALMPAAMGIASADTHHYTYRHTETIYRHYHQAAPVAPSPSVIGPVATEPEDINANAVIVGGTPIMRFRVAAGGYTPAQRAKETQERLNNILSTGPIAPSDISVQQQGADAVVLVKGQLLFTADTATAQYNSSTHLDLANAWADNMRGVLPGLTRAK